MSLLTLPRDGEAIDTASVSLDAFTPIADAWRLSTEEQIRLLGAPPRSTFFKWRKESGAVPRDTAERISHICSIWKSLEILFTDPERSDGWLRRPNEAFGGASALDHMLSGSFYDIVLVRQYLDAQRGG
ncbi:MbcA/ParS/Xre antitoxin family protein [Sphingomonas sp. UYP23]